MKCHWCGKFEFVDFGLMRQPYFMNDYLVLVRRLIYFKVVKYDVECMDNDLGKHNTWIFTGLEVPRDY